MPPSISPTSYKLYTACRRAWWYKYVARMPTPTTPALTNGSAVHAALETYLETGAWPEGEAPAVVQARRAEGTLAELGRLAAARSPRIEVAASTPLEPFGGHGDLKGRVDWTVGGDDTLIPAVVDHKSTANPAYWLGPEQVALDPQLLAYAGALYPGEDVEVAHHYVPPAPHTSALVSARATAGDIEAVVRSFAAASIEMEILRTRATAEEVDPDTSACMNYGGCPFAGACTAAPAGLHNRATRNEEDNVAEIDPAVAARQAALRARLGLGGGGTPPEVAEAPRGPGVTTGTFSASVLPPDAPVEAPPRTKPRRKSTPTSDEPPATCTVLVGCVASDGEGTTLEVWAGAALEAARHEGKTDHGHYLLVPYNGGAKLAAAGIAGALKTGLLEVPPRLTIPAGHPLADLVVPALARHGAAVIRGVR